MFRILMITCLLSTVTRCSRPFDNHQVDGGPCSYDSSRFTATVISVEADTHHLQDSTYIVKVRMSGGYMGDIIMLNHLIRHDISASFLRRHAIKEGSKFTGMGFYIKKGTCTPEIYRFDHPF